MVMRVALMQPYLFPYLPYFQLLNAVDYFLIYDDAQYRKGGLINRNYILLNKTPFLFSLSVERDSFELPINKRFFSEEFFEKDKRKFISTLNFAYKDAPFFWDVKNLVIEIFSNKNRNISDFTCDSIVHICKYLDIKTKVGTCSEIFERVDLLNGGNAEEKVIYRVKKVGGVEYVNSIGGIDLYNKERFSEDKIKLGFLKPKPYSYNQNTDAFVPNLSVIDTLMFNSPDEIRKMLDECEIL